MQHIRPYIVSGSEVLQLLGRDWICPYCRSESPIEGDDDIGWVPIPVESIPQRFMCLGCCEDIHSTCASDDFDFHAYKDLVADVAKQEGYSMEEFRELCVKQQVRAGEQRLQREGDVNRYGDRLQRLRLLLVRH